MTKTSWIRLFSLLALAALVAAPVLAAGPAAATDWSPEALFAPASAQCTAPAAAGTLDLAKGGPPQPPTGGPCGTSICGEGEYCCNLSCSICAPLDGACTQQVCFPDGPIVISAR